MPRCSAGTSPKRPTASPPLRLSISPSTPPAGRCGPTPPVALHSATTTAAPLCPITSRTRSPSSAWRRALPSSASPRPTVWRSGLSAPSRSRSCGAGFSAMPRRFAPRSGPSSRAITSPGCWRRMPTAALLRPGANGSPHAPQSGRPHSSILCPENPGRYMIGSLMRLLGLALPVPDHTTLSRRAAALEVPRPRSGSNADAGREAAPVRLLVDSTGLKLGGPGEWLIEKHGTKTRRSWRALHLGVDADTGEIVAATLTTPDVDDGSQAGPLLDQVAGPVVSFTADGAYDQDRVYASVAERHPEAEVIVPPRASAVPSQTAESTPTQRDRHLQHIAEQGRMAWQRASGYTKRARAEAAIARWKQVLGDRLRAHAEERRATEVDGKRCSVF